MPLAASELFSLARKVELNIAALYEDMVQHLRPGSDEAVFFATMATQEHTHAAWVDEMEEHVASSFMFEGLEKEEFTVILDTIADIHDEVVTEEINLLDSLEIILHLENSTAEEFYLKFPEDVPGLPNSMVERMVKSCVNHATMVATFRNKQAAIHMQ